MKKIIKTYKGWAIDIQSKEGHRLIGRFWTFGGQYPDIPVQLLGHLIAVFETRNAAKKDLADVRKSFPKAKVVRVTVDIVDAVVIYRRINMHKITCSCESWKLRFWTPVFEVVYSHKKKNATFNASVLMDSIVYCLFCGKKLKHRR